MHHCNLVWTGVLVLGVVACRAAAKPRAASAEPLRFRYATQEYGAEEIEIGLSRTECYGPCPVYTVSVHGTGEVFYRGEQHVGTTGELHWRVQPSTVQILLDSFEGMRFLEL